MAGRCDDRNEYGLPFVVSADFGRPATSSMFFRAEVLAVEAGNAAVELKLRHRDTRGKWSEWWPAFRAKI